MARSSFNLEPTSAVEILEIDPERVVVQKATNVPWSELANVFDSTYGAIIPVVMAEGIETTGAAVAVYPRPPSDTISMEIGFPVNRPLSAAQTTDDGLVFENSEIPGGMVARITYIGPYDGLGAAWEAFMTGIAAAGHQPGLPFWEVYVTDTTPETDPATIRTDLVCKLVN